MVRICLLLNVVGHVDYHDEDGNAYEDENVYEYANAHENKNLFSITKSEKRSKYEQHT